MIPLPSIAIGFFQDFSGATKTESDGNYSITILGDIVNSPSTQFIFPTAMSVDWDGSLCAWRVDIIKADGTTDIVTEAEITTEAIMQITLPAGINTLRYRTLGESPENDIYKDITIVYKDDTYINTIDVTVINNGKFIDVNNSLVHIIEVGESDNYYSTFTENMQGDSSPLEIKSIAENGSVGDLFNGEVATVANLMTAADVELFGSSIDLDEPNSTFHEEWGLNLRAGLRPTAGYITYPNTDEFYNKITWKVAILNPTDYAIFLNYWNLGKVLGVIPS